MDKIEFERLRERVLVGMYPSLTGCHLTIGQAKALIIAVRLYEERTINKTKEFIKANIMCHIPNGHDFNNVRQWYEELDEISEEDKERANHFMYMVIPGVDYASNTYLNMRLHDTDWGRKE